MSAKDLAYYLALPYPSELTACAEGGYFARHPDLAGCATQAETIDEAIAGLQEARELWLENQIAAGVKIPEPLSEEPSGRLVLRVPLSLHAALEHSAHDFGLSLNRLLNEVLFNHANSLPLDNGLARPRISASRSPASQVDHYLALQYPITLTPSEEGGFLAEHLDLPGCSAQGENAVKAVAELNIARELWLSNRYEQSLPVSAPLSLAHTGMINLRMPAALHYHLARHATRNGISLNQWLVMALSHFTGANSSHINARSLPNVVETTYGTAKHRIAFLNGLDYLEKGFFVKAFDSFFDAYRGGLNFTTTGADIYRSMPDPMSPRQLHELLFELSQNVPANTRDKQEVHFLLIAWLQEIKDNPRRQEEWLANDRAARSQTAA